MTAEHAMTAQLSWHMQKFVAIIWLHIMIYDERKLICISQLITMEKSLA